MPPRNLQGKQQRRQSTYKLPVEEGIFLTKEKACDRITIRLMSECYKRDTLL